MRVLVLVLVLLAAAKIGTQQYLITSTKNEIIIATYRDRAVDACRQEARTKKLDFPVAWSGRDDIRLVIGKASLDISLWQVDHALWQARYKNPYLLFESGPPKHRLFCEFDIAQDTASVMRM